jgi:diguanylate cyclase (GGDEF)-like protein
MNVREELRERAEKDLLTMLPNRSAIDSILEQELSRCHREGRSVGVVLLDLDKFKSVNDTFGHFAGDEVLRETAHRLRSNMRPYDRVGRYGGEEFLVVLPNSDLEQSRQQAERLRLLLDSQPMFVEGRELPVKASFGVTVSDGTDRPIDLFVRTADEALYEAKNNGRNRVVTKLVSEASFHNPSKGPVPVNGASTACEPEIVVR